MKQLKKSKNKIIAGVCGGIAESLKIDPTLVRLIIFVLGLCTKGILVLLYIVAAFVMPEAGFGDESSSDDVENLKSANIEKEEFVSESKNGKDETSSPHSDEEFNSYFKK